MLFSNRKNVTKWDSQHNVGSTGVLETSVALTKIKLEDDIPSCSHSKSIDTKLSTPRECLESEFGYNEFRPIQWSIIESILKDKRDNCAIVTAGCGQSLIYQFTAVYSMKVVVVVSLHVCLMEEQMSKLNLQNRACIYKPDDKVVEKKILALDFNVVYATPESITSEAGLNLLLSLGSNLILIAVKEAHYISERSPDFHASFRKLRKLRIVVPKVPLLALTAVATLKVRDDICDELGLRSPQLLKSSCDRPNLCFIVRQKSILKNGLGVLSDLSSYILWAMRMHGSVIVYCNTIDETQRVAAILSQHVLCKSYHSGLSLEEQKKCHHEFLMDDIFVIVATMKRGMIIDKLDVRLVVHYGAPSDMERYYHELNCGGRDGLLTKCVLFYNSEDWKALRDSRVSHILKEAQLEDLVVKIMEYAHFTNCRRKFILEYFNDEAAELVETHKDCCDNCIRKLKTIDYSKMYDGLDENGKLDITHDARMMLNLIWDLNGCYGLCKVISILRGSRRQDLPQHFQRHVLYGMGAAKSIEWYKLIDENLQKLGYVYYIKKLGKFGEYRVPLGTEKSRKWLYFADPAWKPITISPYAEVLKFLKRKKDEHLVELTPPECEFEGTVLENQIMMKLLRLRTSLSCELNVMPYMIASSKALTQLVKMKPKTMEELMACKLDGFYTLKYERFGERMLNCLNCEEKFNRNCEMHTNEPSTSRKMETSSKSLSKLQIQHSTVSWGAENFSETKKSDNELDILLDELKKMQKEMSFKYAIIKKRPAIKYTDTDSSDEEKQQEKLKYTAATEKPSPKKIRKLPDWMNNLQCYKKQ